MLNKTQKNLINIILRGKDEVDSLGIGVPCTLEDLTVEQVLTFHDAMQKVKGDFPEGSEFDGVFFVKPSYIFSSTIKHICGARVLIISVEELNCPSERFQNIIYKCVVDDLLGNKNG